MTIQWNPSNVGPPLGPIQIVVIRGVPLFQGLFSLRKVRSGPRAVSTLQWMPLLKGCAQCRGSIVVLMVTYNFLFPTQMLDGMMYYMLIRIIQPYTFWPVRIAHETAFLIRGVKHSPSHKPSLVLTLPVLSNLHTHLVSSALLSLCTLYFPLCNLLKPVLTSWDCLSWATCEPHLNA